MTRAITERQQFILNAIRQFIELNGYPPTVRELAELCQIKTHQGVLRHLDALEKKNLIERDSKARTIRLLDCHPLFKTSATPSPSSQLRDLGQDWSGQVERVPLVGRVAAGVPIPAIENVEEQIPVSSDLLRHNRDSFFLKVRGDSMTDGIQPNDLILVTPGLEVRRSEIVVALIDDEATVKRYYPDNDRVILRADNPRYADIIVSRDLRIVGKVTGLVRQY